MLTHSMYGVYVLAYVSEHPASSLLALLMLDIIRNDDSGLTQLQPVLIIVLSLNCWRRRGILQIVRLLHGLQPRWDVGSEDLKSILLIINLSWCAICPPMEDEDGLHEIRHLTWQLSFSVEGKST